MADPVRLPWWAFWWRWPSIVGELLSGGGLQLSLHFWGPLHPWWLYAPTGLVISLFYERFLDRNGWEWKDVWQRALGQALGELLWGGFACH
jgi:hypothetical protein